MAVRLAVAAATAVLAATFAPPASACAGEVCDTINEVCVVVRGHPCVR